MKFTPKVKSQMKEYSSFHRLPATAFPEAQSILDLEPESWSYSSLPGRGQASWPPARARMGLEHTSRGSREELNGLPLLSPPHLSTPQGTNWTPHSGGQPPLLEGPSPAWKSPLRYSSFSNMSMNCALWFTQKWTILLRSRAVKQLKNHRASWSCGQDTGLFQSSALLPGK